MHGERIKIFKECLSVAGKTQRIKCWQQLYDDDDDDDDDDGSTLPVDPLVTWLLSHGMAG
jgi:hypothetical protein